MLAHLAFLLKQVQEIVLIALSFPSCQFGLLCKGLPYGGQAQRLETAHQVGSQTIGAHRAATSSGCRSPS